MLKNYSICLPGRCLTFALNTAPLSHFSQFPTFLTRVGTHGNPYPLAAAAGAAAERVRRQHVRGGVRAVPQVFMLFP